MFIDSEVTRANTKPELSAARKRLFDILRTHPKRREAIIEEPAAKKVFPFDFLQADEFHFK
jgi:hypothetical protein